MAKSTMARKACSLMLSGALVLGGTGAVLGTTAMAPTGDTGLAGIEQAQAREMTYKSKAKALAAARAEVKYDFTHNSPVLRDIWVSDRGPNTAITFTVDPYRYSCSFAYKTAKMKKTKSVLATEAAPKFEWKLKNSKGKVKDSGVVNYKRTFVTKCKGKVKLSVRARSASKHNGKHVYSKWRTWSLKIK